MKIPFSIYAFFGYLASGFVVLGAFDMGFSQGWLSQSEFKLIPGLALVFAAYILGHAVAHIAWSLIEECFVRKILCSPEETLFKSDFPTKWKKVFPGFYKPLPLETQQAVLRRAKQSGIAGPGQGLFFHCHATVMQNQNVKERLDSFLNLYGFARNVSFACSIAAIILLIASMRDVWASPRTVHINLLGFAFIALIVAFIMLYRYLKFFRHFTTEVFRVFAVTELKKGDS